MNDTAPTYPHRSWLDKISQLLLGEPKDRDELMNVLREAEQNEVLDPDALRMIEGVMHVSVMRVREVMIPRSQMVVVEKDAPLSDIMPHVLDSAHSRFPVVDSSKDDVVGILLAKDLLSACYNRPDDKFHLRELLRPAVFVPESKRLNVLLQEFKENHNHLAVVVDEYGGVTGLITIEDVLEQIVGDIEDEHDIDEGSYVRQHSDSQYLIKAQMPLEEFNQYFNSQLSNEEFDTIGGSVLQAFGHLPKRGESIAIGPFHFTVLRADKRRVLLLKLSLNAPKQQDVPPS